MTGKITVPSNITLLPLAALADAHVDGFTLCAAFSVESDDALIWEMEAPLSNRVIIGIPISQRQRTVPLSNRKQEVVHSRSEEAFQNRSVGTY